ncbi:MAG: M14 family zinc carboxypeptidase [Mycobacteriales bacterium]
MRSRYAAVLVSAFIAASAAVPASAAAAAPRTAFELRSDAGWTTLREEAAFVAQLDAASPRVRTRVVGVSAGRRPITLLIVGPPRSDAEIAAGSSALVVCTQHGNEPAPREACLQRARDLAFGINTQTVLFIATANPDGVAADTRGNASGADINRTHTTLSTLEARAISNVMAAYRPDVLNDLHEYQQPGARLVLTRNDATFGPAVSPTIKAYAVHLRHRYQEPAIEAGSYVTGPYPAGVIFGSLAEISAQKGIVSALTETPRAGQLSVLQRVDAHRRSMDGTLAMLAARRADLARVTR